MRYQLRHIPIDGQFRRQDSNLHLLQFGPFTALLGQRAAI